MYDSNELQFILHVSDFHLTKKNDGQVIAQKALKALTRKLKEENIKIDYLVHTGDVINSSDLHEDVAKKFTFYSKYVNKEGKFDFERFAIRAKKTEKNKFNTELKKITRSRYKTAQKIMIEFINDLNISVGNVVICCGNHDAMRLAYKGKGSPVCKKGNEGTREYTYACGEETSLAVKSMTHEDVENKKKEEENETRVETEEVFRPFDAFLDRLGVANSKKRNEVWDKDYPVTHCTLGNLNFLILNTNWRTPKTVKPSYFCVHCDQIHDAIMCLEEKNKGKAKMLNIVVAHKPIYEICETARLSYKRYIKTSFMANIQDYIGENGIYLCGDKHTRSVVGSAFHDIPHYIGGEPFTEKNEETGDYEVEYNLLGVAAGQLGLERKIHLRSEDGENWICDIRPQDAIVSKLYELSKGHISPMSYAMIEFLNTRNTWEALCQRLYESNACNIAQDDSLNVYFKAICKYRENGTRDHTWKKKDNVFEYVYDRIRKGMDNDSNKNILNLRGGYSSGKSTYLGLLYIYLLYQYSIGAIKFIPVYFALENDEMLENVKSSSSYYDAVKLSFSDFAKKVHDISVKEQQSVCYIIDRLDEQDCWSLSSEDSVGRCLLDILAKYDDAWYIMSFGQHRLPYFKNTMPVRKYSDKSDVLYFNPIDVRERTSTDPDERFKSFVQTYLDLEKFPAKFVKDEKETQDKVTDQQVEDICKIIRNFRRLTITPGFMRQNYEYITEVDEEKNTLRNVNATVKEIYGYYIDRQYERCLQRLGYGFVDYAPAMAFLFAYQGYTYERFKHLRDDSSLREKHALRPICENQDKIYNAFMFIKKHRDSREYLTALHYHRELRYYAEHPSEEIEDDSILNEFVTRNVAVEIRKMWTDTNKFVIVCEKLIQRKKISNRTLSMLAYCLAHIPMYKPIRYALQIKLYARGEKAIKDQDWEIPEMDSKKKLEYFLDLSLKHTMEIYCLMDETHSFEVVKKMIGNEMFAKYNRQHQMLYYRDLSIRGEDKFRLLDPGKDIVYKGFDFHHCFNYLYVKLNSKEQYPLREFDLYTLCDLVSSRLEPQNIRIYEGGASGKEDTFFHWQKSNEKAVQVLEQVKAILDAYLGEVKKPSSKPDEVEKEYVSVEHKAYKKYAEGGEDVDAKQIVIGYFQNALIRMEEELAKRKPKVCGTESHIDDKITSTVG